MSRYLSLDQSKSRTGWAFWKEGLDRPLVGSWPKLGDPETPRGKVFAKVHMNLAPMKATHGFTSLCYEEAVNPQHFNRATSPDVPFLLINIAGHIESYCAAAAVRCNAVASNKWRPWFLDGVGRGRKRWELKDFVIERCRQLGMAPRNDDEADACGILDYHLYLEGITPPWRMEHVLLPALGGAR